MLLQFSVDNFRSIKDNMLFSMLASTEDNDNSIEMGEDRILRSAVLYGANASGKSNLLKAMSRMRALVLNHTKVSQSVDRLTHEPFKLNSSTENASTTYEIIFFIDNKRYRYGFENDSTTIYAEWLFEKESRKESKLFYRDAEDEFYVNPTRFKEGKGLEEKTLNNHLFLWKCDSENGKISQAILKWFFNFNMIDGYENRGYIDYSRKELSNDNFKQDIINLVQVADLGIDDMSTHEEEVSTDMLDTMQLPKAIKDELVVKGGLMKVETSTVHKKFDKVNNEIGSVSFELDKDESIGTQKFFAMSAPILDTLRNGKILIIDELDASLHPILTMHLIEMFHNKETNQKNAQLIFATHDTNLLQTDLFRRDQVWFAEKDRYGATSIYSLLEYKYSTRKTTNKEKNYLNGRYGAIPFIGEFQFEDKE
jgi:AAA15 family ATPase/GTPase